MLYQLEECHQGHFQGQVTPPLRINGTPKVATKAGEMSPAFVVVDCILWREFSLCEMHNL